MKKRNWLLVGEIISLFWLFSLFSTAKAEEYTLQISDDQVEAVLEKMIGEKLERIIERRLLESEVEIQKNNEEIERLEAELIEENGFLARELLTEDSEYKDKIVINEIMPNPEGDDKGKEWIELYNATEKEIYLTGWTMKDTSKIKHAFPSDFALPAREYRYFLPKFNLNNSGEEKVILLDATNKIISEVSYYNAPEGESWARKEDGSFAWTKLLTPGEENQFNEEEIKVEENEIKEEQQGDYLSLILNEALLNPDGADSGKEWVEIFNPHAEAIELTGWQIENSDGKKHNLTGKIEINGYYLVELKNNNFSLRNADEEIKLRNPSGEEVDRVFVEGSALSGKSFARAEADDWRWTKYLTPGQKNKFNQLPKVKIDKPKRLYPGEYGIFDASKTKDGDGDKLRFTWIWDDDKKSYQAKTKRKFEEKGSYQVILKVNDGTDEIEERFKIKVNDYPKQNLKIVGILPNPTGADSGKEKIVLKNNSNKAIDLLNWQLALGNDESSLSVRKITKSVKIQAGETLNLFSGNGCRFSLNNSGGIVELRYPDGNKTDQVEYFKEKIEEGEEFVLVGENWIWQNGKKESVEIKKAGNVSQKKIGNLDTHLATGKVWRWWEVTQNEAEKICESSEKLSYDNWKSKNLPYLKFLGFLK